MTVSPALQVLQDLVAVLQVLQDRPVLRAQVAVPQVLQVRVE